MKEEKEMEGKKVYVIIESFMGWKNAVAVCSSLEMAEAVILGYSVRQNLDLVDCEDFHWGGRRYYFQYEGKGGQYDINPMVVDEKPWDD